MSYASFFLENFLTMTMTMTMTFYVHRDTESLTITMTMTMTFLVGLRPRRPKGRGNEGARGRERTLVNIKNVSLTEGK